MAKKAIVKDIVKVPKAERKQGGRKLGLIEYPGGKRQRLVGCFKASRCPDGMKAVRTASIKEGISCKARHRSCQSNTLYKKTPAPPTPVVVKKTRQPAAMSKRAYIRGRELWNKGDRSAKAIPPGTPTGMAQSELYNYMVSGTPGLSGIALSPTSKADVEEMRRVDKVLARHLFK